MAQPPTPDRKELLRSALLRIEQLEARLRDRAAEVREPIAIVGLACRFPAGANDPHRFWNLLRDGVDAISEVPRTRWDIDAVYDPSPDTPGKMYARGGGF